MTTVFALWKTLAMKVPARVLLSIVTTAISAPSIVAPRFRDASPSPTRPTAMMATRVPSTRFVVGVNASLQAPWRVRMAISVLRISVMRLTAVYFQQTRMRAMTGMHARSTMPVEAAVVREVQQKPA